jgi:cytosine/adenosine deaminase-related metal-dependent hydrolase
VRLKSSWVLPIASDPIENGEVVVEGGKIMSVETSSSGPTGDVLDLGNAILLPGFVNAHTHLEHSALFDRTTQHLPFTLWADQVTQESRKLSHDDIQTAVLEKALPRLLEGGSTTIVDHAHPSSRIEVPHLRRLVNWEVLGSDFERAATSWKLARERQSHEGGWISPHSLYAVHPEVVREILASNPEFLSLHFLESKDEDLYLRRSQGPLADYIKDRGGFVVQDPAPPLDRLSVSAAKHRTTLLVHGNHILLEEYQNLAKFKIGLVHCPGSHAFFDEPSPRFDLIREFKIPLALGTDSLASNEDVSMLREMRLFHERHPEYSHRDIVVMATRDAANLIGLGDRIGTLEPGKEADLIAVRIPANSEMPLNQFASILKSREVVFSMIQGKVVLSHV